MNYIKVLNDFESWSETHPLSAGAQALWFRLLAIFNRAFWPPCVRVSHCQLMAVCGLGEKAFAKAARELCDAGLILYEPAVGRRDCAFSLCPAAFERKSPRASPAACAPGPGAPSFDTDDFARLVLERTPAL